jgi:hypothetical protein
MTNGIVYARAARSISAIINILFDGENISFDASLVIYKQYKYPSDYNYE